MAKRRLETMSPDLAARLPAIRDKWLKIGLMTGPADRAAAWEGMKRAYELAGRKPPTLQLWFESPFAAVIACAMLGTKKVSAQVSDQVRDQVRAQVRAQVSDQVRDQVRDQVSDQVSDQVRAQVSAQVRAQVLDQVLAQVRDQVRAQVRAQVRDQVLAQVLAQVRAQVSAQVRAQVRAQVSDQVRAQVRDQVRDQVLDQVLDQVSDQVRAHVRAQVRAQVSDQVRDQVRAQVRAQVSAQVRDQVRDQVRNQVRAQVSAQVRAQVSDQVRDQVIDQVIDQVSDQVLDQAYQFADLWWLPGQFYDAYWLSYYDALRDCCSFEKLEGLIMVCENSAFAWTFPDIVIFCDRPVRISRDDRGRLHHESRAAVEFADGWGVHAWHGVRCEADVIERPEAITVKRVDTERNAEIRRVMIERFGGGRDKGGGPEAYLTAAGAKVIDHEEGIGTLRRREIADDEPLVMVDVVNSTREPDGSFKRYSLRVPPNITKAREAVAWTFGKTAAQYRPQIET